MGVEGGGHQGSHVLSLDRRGVGLPEFVVRFVSDGLRADDRVLWIAPFPSVQQVRSLLRGHGIDAARHEAEGRLVFRPLDAVLLRGGTFEAGPALAALRDELLLAARRGSGAMRLVQDLCGSRSEPLDADALREYEAGVDALVSRSPLHVLCVYDLGRATPVETMAAVDAHPRILERGRPVANPFCIPTDLDAVDEALHRLELVLRYREGRTATRRHAALVRLLRGMVVQAGVAPSHDGAVELCLRELCRFAGWPVGHALRPDPETGHPRSTGIWYTSGQERYVAFAEAFSRLDSDAPGLPGRVVETGKPGWISDLARDPAFLHRELTQRAGLHSAIALPVVAGGKVLAVLEFFAPGHEDPDPDRLDVLQYVGMALGRVLEFIRVEGELSRSERRFRALVESAADAILIADEDGRIVSVNPAATRLFGYAAREVVGHHLGRLVPARLLSRYRSAFERLVAGEVTAEGRVFEVVGLAKDGREIPLEVSLAGWAEERRYFSAILREISDRKEAEAELRLLGSAVAHVRDAIVVTTAGTAERRPTIRYANQAFRRMTGFSESEILGRGFDLLTGPRTDTDALRAVYDRLARGKPATTEIVAYHRDGSHFLLEWSASPIEQSDGSTPYFVSIQRDITGERIAEQALRRVDRDALTGLANRDVLIERLRRAIERCAERRDQRYALLFMDLDGFKAVNDQQGHVFGDRVLESVAQRLQQSMRPGDTVARFGGDEFVVLLDHVTGIPDVVVVAERIQEAVRHPLSLRGREIHLGASMGIALSDSGYADPEHAVRAADTAMYRAKRKGRGATEFADPERYRDVLTAIDLREGLRRSIEQEELRLRYQPLVDLESGGIVGFEALVRWLHPRHGMVHPKEFVPLAEETGLIVPMGRWILREACRTARGWEELGSAAPPVLSVNLSVPELTSPGLVQSVRSTLDDTGFEASRLLVELTESVFSDTPAPLRDRLSELRDLGIQVCIDDFGTGYSSLGRLHRFPVDKLKIDQMFVRDLEEAPGNTEIIRTILSLADGLGLDVVAEGVETDRQLERLKGMDCRYGQGFLFSRPLPADGVPAVLAGGLGEPSDTLNPRTF